VQSLESNAEPSDDKQPQAEPTEDFPFPAVDPFQDADQDLPSQEKKDPVEEGNTNPEKDIEPVLDETTSIQEQENIPEEESHPTLEKVGSLTLDEDSTYLITIILKNRGDTMRDKLRLRQIYGTLISYPGKDRFVFQITENNQSHLLEFPNASTKISKNLINQLKNMLGQENVQVEKYLF
jgi:hypothetical protein